MADLNDLFGKGLDLGNDFVAKAQLRARVREPRYPVASALVDTLVLKYEERLAVMMSAIEAELRRDNTQIKSLYIDKSTGKIFYKADAPPKALEAPKTPSSTLSGQPRQARGEGANANYKRPQGGVHNAGSRGGKWYRDDKGNVRYGDRPTARYHTAAEPEHVIAHHQKYVGKTPFLPGSADAHQFEHFTSVIDVAHKKGIFSDTDLEFITWFKDNFKDQFLPVMGTDISMEDIEESHFDMEKVFSTEENSSFAEVIEEFFRTMAEPFVDEDGNEEPAVFVGEDEFGEPEDSDEVVDTVRGIMERYQDAMSDPDVQAAMMTAEKERQMRYASWSEALGMRADEYAPLEDDLLNTQDGTDAALRTVVAMSEMDMFKRAGSGEVLKASMRGMWMPNANLMSDMENDNAVLSRMSSAQLINAYSASRMNDSLTESVTGNWSYSIGSNSKLSDKILAEYMQSRGLEKGSAKYDLTLEQMERNLDGTISMINTFNKGVVDDQFLRHMTVKQLAGNKSALQEAQAQIEDRENFIAELMEAQEDDSFEMPDTMKDGVWGSHDLEGHEALDPSHMIDPENPDRGNWKPLGYQKKYLNWMHKVKRGIVAADAGMGKTPMIITFMEQLRAQGKGQRAILVLPPALMEQWPQEIARFAPEMQDKILNLSGRTMEERKALLSDPESLANAEYVIMSSGTLKGSDEMKGGKGEALEDDDGEAPPDDEMIEILKNLDGAMFIDECHMGGYKTPHAGRHQVARQVMEGREYAFGLTATPIPNDPVDLWHLSDMFAPDQLGSLDNWKGKLSGATFDRETRSWEVQNIDGVAELNERTKPFVFQKNITDADVVEDMSGGLTAKTGWTDNPDEGDLDISHKVQANGLSQFDYFKRDGVIEHMVRVKVREQVNKVIKEARALQDAGILDSGDFEGHVHDKMKGYSRLADGYRMNLQRQASISPALIDPTYRDEGGGVAHSPKLKAVCDDIISHFSRGGNAGESGKGTVVFCTYPGKAFPLIQKALAERGVDPSLVATIQSGVGNDDRAIQQDAFNAGKHKVMLVGIKSGGAGLNLQKHANSVIFMDEPWSPADKRQAQGRVWRTGQKSQVYEKTYRTTGTYDGIVESRLGGKQAMSSALLGREAPNEDTFSDTVHDEISKLMGRSSSDLAIDSAKVTAGERSHRKVTQDGQGGTILQQIIGEEMDGDVGEHTQTPEFLHGQKLAASAFAEAEYQKGHEWADLTPSKDGQAKLKESGADKLTEKHDKAAYKKEWRAKRKHRNAVASVNSARSMGNFNQRKLDDLDPNDEDFEFHKDRLTTQVEKYNRTVSSLEKQFPKELGVSGKAGTKRRGGKAGEEASAKNKTNAADAKAKAAVDAIKMTGAQSHALHRVSPAGGKSSDGVSAKTLGILTKQGLVSETKSGHAITALGTQLLKRKDVHAHVSERSTKAAKKASETKKKTDAEVKTKASYDKAAAKITKKKAKASSKPEPKPKAKAKLVVKKKAKAAKAPDPAVEKTSTKGVEFLKLKHGLGTDSDERIHDDIDVPQHEAATIFNKLKRSNHKNWSEFIKEEIKPHWQGATMKEMKGYMQEVMDALHHAGVVKKHKVK